MTSFLDTSRKNKTGLPEHIGQELNGLQKFEDWESRNQRLPVFVDQESPNHGLPDFENQEPRPTICNDIADKEKSLKGLETDLTKALENQGLLKDKDQELEKRISDSDIVIKSLEADIGILKITASARKKEKIALEKALANSENGSQQYVQYVKKLDLLAQEALSCAAQAETNLEREREAASFLAISKEQHTILLRDQEQTVFDLNSVKIQLQIELEDLKTKKGLPKFVAGTKADFQRSAFVEKQRSREVSSLRQHVQDMVSLRKELQKAQVQAASASALAIGLQQRLQQSSDRGNRVIFNERERISQSHLNDEAIRRLTDKLEAKERLLAHHDQALRRSIDEITQLRDLVHNLSVDRDWHATAYKSLQDVLSTGNDERHETTTPTSYTTGIHALRRSGAQQVQRISELGKF